MAAQQEVYSFGQTMTAEVKEGFTLLDPGTYDFRIMEVEKAQFEPKQGSKLPACPMATVKFEVFAPNGDKTTINERFWWCKSMFWKVTNLFIAVGLAKKDEDFAADPDALLGKKGKVKLDVEAYTKQNGNPGTRNIIKGYDDPTVDNFGGF